MKNRLSLSIAVGMILGVIVGYACHTSISDPVTLKTVAGYFSIVTDIFLRLIKMIIAPLVFSTLVSGLADMDSGQDVVRIGLRYLCWVIIAVLVSWMLG